MSLSNYLRNIVGAISGKPMAFNTSGYNGATMGRRMVNVATSFRGASSLALSDGIMLTARARKAAMDNPRATVGVQSFRAEVVGTGIRPHSNHPDPDKRHLIEHEFHLWTIQSSAVRRLMNDGSSDSLQDFFCQQGLVCDNVIVAGEAFARLRPRLTSDLSPIGLRVPLQVELIEPEQLPQWKTSGEMASPTNLIRGGIEFDKIKRRVAYHFYKHNPGDSALWPDTYEVVRVPASSILHVMEFLRGDQIRGITALAPILVALSDFDEYDDAERFRQKLGAYMFAWKKTSNPDNPNMELNSTVGNDSADPGTAYLEMQPGQLNILDSNINEDFDFYAHPGVENGYEPFMKVQNRHLATAQRISYDMLTGDMTEVNYSSARVRLIALRRQWRQFQRSVLEHQFCRPVFRAWLDAAALAGVINASDYKKNPELYQDVEWLPQPWEWIDPKTDITGIRMEIESCLTSRSRVVTSRGRNIMDLDNEISADHEREAKLGLAPVYGASRVTEAEPAGDNEDLGDETSAPTAPLQSTKPAPAQPAQHSKKKKRGKKNQGK